MTTPDPLAGLMLPQATVLAPRTTDSQFLEVSAGPSRSTQTIFIPVGTSQIVVDWNIPSGSLNIRTRFYLNQQLSFPIGYTTMSGTGTWHLRMVNDDPDGWLALQGTATSGAVDTARVGVTIYPIAATT